MMSSSWPTDATVTTNASNVESNAGQTLKFWGNQPVDTPVLTLAEVNYLMRCAKRDTRLAKILEKIAGHDDAFEIQTVFYKEPDTDEEED